MGYTEIHFEEPHRAVAEAILQRVEAAGHTCDLVCRDAESELRTLAHFLTFHTSTGAAVFLVAGPGTFHARWMNREIELLARLLLDQDEQILSAVSLVLVGQAAAEAFPLRGEAVATLLVSE